MKLTFVALVLLLTMNFCNAQQNITTMKEFKNTGWQSLNENVIELIGHEWMLITAGSVDNGFNMMTASWGGMGWLWEQPVVFIFVRPQRYTHEFTEREEYFTLTFFESEYKEILRKMGSVSGRTYDKINNSGLTPVATEHSSVAFAEARIVVECKKIYSTVIKEEGFEDGSTPAKMYPQKDFHTLYVGSIVNVWMKAQ